MFSQNDLEKIKEEAEEFFRKMTFGVEIELFQKEEGASPAVYIDVKAEEPQILIGDNGQTLFDIQRLLKIILKRKIKEIFFIDVDISDYKKKKIEYLKDLARNAADEAALTKKEKVLPAMPAYERRIIHLELSGRQDVIAESVGQEPDRKIVVKQALSS